MLAARIRQINNLMAATCVECDDLCHWGLLVDVVDQGVGCRIIWHVFMDTQNRWKLFEYSRDAHPMLAADAGLQVNSLYVDNTQAAITFTVAAR